MASVREMTSLDTFDDGLSAGLPLQAPHVTGMARTLDHMQHDSSSRSRAERAPVGRNQPSSVGASEVRRSGDT
jgi:hypothetical protein